MEEIKSYSKSIMHKFINGLSPEQMYSYVFFPSFTWASISYLFGEEISKYYQEKEIYYLEIAPTSKIEVVEKFLSKNPIKKDIILQFIREVQNICLENNNTDGYIYKSLDNILNEYQETVNDNVNVFPIFKDFYRYSEEAVQERLESVYTSYSEEKVVKEDITQINARNFIISKYNCGIVTGIQFVYKKDTQKNQSIILNNTIKITIDPLIKDKIQFSFKETNIEQWCSKIHQNIWKNEAGIFSNISLHTNKEGQIIIPKYLKSKYTKQDIEKILNNNSKKIIDNPSSILDIMEQFSYKRMIDTPWGETIIDMELIDSEFNEPYYIGEIKK